jgi:hypothetical protein
MILIDTTVISELMKPEPDPKVLEWISRQESAGVFITSITIAEIIYGINALPEGLGRDGLEKLFNKTILLAFEDRILSFDEPAAHLYGKIMGDCKRLGRPMGVPDGEIAAIAQLHDASLATRNVRDFKNCGVEIINPFTA